ncbi:VOC family protein [Agrococcus terreus]|uniref:Lyase n=1 Tax=Agrococcus terreus TaxID=574649 RepID=A0ABQ2KNW0_9MICO|nr:VOC family protein [Agrococcus terreus]GGN86975.1 lyase [Agrococcus terreus]
MSVSISAVHVVVDDPDAAVAFYRDVLGMAVENQVDQGGFRWVTLSPPGQPGIQLVLSHPRAGRSEADGEAVAALLAKGELGSVNLRADDLDAVFERAAAHEGAEVVQEPTDQFWGVRDIALRDPAGNLVRIEQAR